MAPVWAHYDQARLDAEYNAAGTVPSLEPYFARYRAESARVRSACARELDVAYGTGERERLDLFGAPVTGAPVLVFMHGGFWRRLSKDEFSFFAEPFAQAGAVVAIPSYSLAPAASLDDMVRQMRAAVLWLHENVREHGGDPHRIVVAGHSAGGQLAGMLAGTDWREYGVPTTPIVGVCGISGLYELEPVRRSNVNDWLHLDAASAERNSPSAHLPARSMPLVAAVGERETGEFLRQTADYAAAWSALGYPADELVMRGQTHYDVVLDVLDAGSTLRALILRLLGR